MKQMWSKLQLKKDLVLKFDCDKNTFVSKLKDKVFLEELFREEIYLPKKQPEKVFVGEAFFNNGFSFYKRPIRNSTNNRVILKGNYIQDGKQLIIKYSVMIRKKVVVSLFLFLVVITIFNLLFYKFDMEVLLVILFLYFVIIFIFYDLRNRVKDLEKTFKNQLESIYNSIK